MLTVSSSIVLNTGASTILGLDLRLVRRTSIVRLLHEVHPVHAISRDHSFGRRRLTMMTVSSCPTPATWQVG